jgi:hypothetical protein
MHSAIEKDAEITALRKLHQLLDTEVLKAYGWSDVEFGHDFRPTEDGPRFTVSEPVRVEILDRLLELNHARHAEEFAQGLATSAKSKRVAKGRAKSSPAQEGAQELLEL